MLYQRKTKVEISTLSYNEIHFEITKIQFFKTVIQL